MTRARVQSPSAAPFFEESEGFLENERVGTRAEQ
jgi:hypothetical protein